MDNNNNAVTHSAVLESEAFAVAAAEYATLESVANTSFASRAILAIDKCLSRVFSIIAFTALGLLAVSMFVQVILRYVFNNPFLGIEETSILLGVWVYFIGMALSIRRRESIHGGIVTLVISNLTAIRIIRLIGTVVCLCAVVIFGSMALDYVLFVAKVGKLSLYLGWPKALWPLSLALGFGGAIVYFVFQLYAEFRALRK
ncbi:MAG: TRAP transporter small permease [Pseudomonadales bacterium]